MKPLIIYNNTKPSPIKMRDMEFFSFAIIIDDSFPEYQDKLVWRMAEDRIVDMTDDLLPADCWSGKSDLKVQPVQVKMTLEVL